MSLGEFQQFIDTIMDIAYKWFMVLNVPIIGNITYLNMLIATLVLTLVTKFFVNVIYGDRQQSSTYRRNKNE